MTKHLIKSITNTSLLTFIQKKNFLLKKNWFFNNLRTEQQNVKTIINLKITPNNTIITLSHNNKLLYSLSTGKLKLNSSKKNYKTIYNLVLTEFIKKLKELKLKKNVLIRIVSPKILRHKIIRRFKFYLTDSNIYQIPRQYSFNGCRVKKIKRKKRKGLRLFKPKL